MLRYGEKIMTKQEEWTKLIQATAYEQGYDIENPESLKFNIFIDRWHAVAFQVWNNNSSGYIEVSQWEEGQLGEDSTYGRGVYSLRSYSDVVQFCSILISSSSIRAKRKDVER